MDFIQSHILSLILFTPTAAAVLVLLLPRERVGLVRWVAFLASLVPLGLSIGLWFAYDASQAGYQFVERAAWYQAVNSSFHLGVDGISLPMTLLTTLLTPLAVLISWSVSENV
ncbi:MAG: hypothetical protein MUO38_07695, partial [Anaerolineales bacterium]|nr:hypothetical protein [Anaerolineales bacterium]